MSARHDRLFPLLDSLLTAADTATLLAARARFRAVAHRHSGADIFWLEHLAVEQEIKLLTAELNEVTP